MALVKSTAYDLAVVVLLPDYILAHDSCSAITGAGSVEEREKSFLVEKSDNAVRSKGESSTRYAIRETLEKAAEDTHRMSGTENLARRVGFSQR